jgi:hypothetical protein
MIYISSTVREGLIVSMEDIYFFFLGKRLGITLEKHSQSNPEMD